MKRAGMDRIGIFAELAATGVLIAAIVLLWRDNLHLLLAVLGIAAAVLALHHRKRDVIFFVVIAVLGSVAEGVFVHFGVWRYGNPSVLGIPMWFPVAFGTAGLLGARLVKSVSALWQQASDGEE